MNKLTQQEEKEIIVFIKDWLKAHGYTQKDLADELNIKNKTSEIIIKIRDIYRKGGIFNLAKVLIKIEQKWLKNNQNNSKNFKEIQSYNQLNIKSNENENEPYNQLGLDSLVNLINKDTDLK